MNCTEFQTIVNELVYDKVVDAETRQTGLSHAALCADCAMLLSETQDVRTALQMTRRGETEEAPARVRQSLLASFSEQRRAGTPGKVVTAPATITSISSRRKFAWLGAAAVAAAAALLIALLLPMLLRRTPTSKTSDGAVVIKSSPIPLETPKKQPPTPAPQISKERVAGVQHAIPHPKHNGLVARTSRKPNRVEKVTSEASAKKTGNEFLPLTYLASATAMESGTVVRVKLSRATLITLGFPVNVEHADDVVKADLIVGDDGVARAIRLVD
jgi:hypothetical protein